MVLGEGAKRLLIYFFYDNDGIIDDYIPYMLSDLKKNVSKIFFVSNGKIEKESRKKISGLADTVFERKNFGLDAWAYKESLEKIGFENLNEYDEVILMNYTIMGPVYPFGELFEKMDKEDIDFWGLTKFFKTDFDPFGTIDIGYIPEHLQSHFIAVRKSMFSTDEYRKYWENLPEIKDYNDSVGMHETKFTRHFASLGFKWKCSTDMDDLEEQNPNAIIFSAVKLLSERRCPVFKRRSFMHDYDNVISNTAGESAFELMEYIKNNTDYDTALIWQNILRCYNMQVIKDALQLNYILPKEPTQNTVKKKSAQKKKIALIFHAYFPDLIDSTVKYVNSMPENADIYITTNTAEKKKFFEEKFKNNKFNHLEVIQIENRGRDVSALLVAAKGFIMDYDYVCFAHDKKVGQLDPKSIGAGFAYQCLENTLGSEGFVRNVIELFEENPNMGIIMPPPPSHSDYYITLSMKWGPNFKKTKQLYNKLGLTVPMSEKYFPIAPLGTMFWFRPNAMKILFDCDWQYEDFPKEPNKIDGTLLHAVERIYGYVVQQAGYYAAWCMIDYGASIMFSNYYYMLSSYSPIIFDNGIKGDFNFTKNKLETTLKFARFDGDTEDKTYTYDIDFDKSDYKFTLYSSLDGVFTEKNKDRRYAKAEGDMYAAEFKLSKTGKKYTEFRIDPGETNGFVVKRGKVVMTYIDGTCEAVDIFDCKTNAVTVKGELVFATPDPQIMFGTSKEERVVSVKIYVDAYGLNIGGIFKLMKQTQQDIIDRASSPDYKAQKLPLKEDDCKFKLYYAKDNAFGEDKTVKTVAKEDGEYVFANFNIPENEAAVNSLRIDPGELANVRLDDLEITVELMSGGSKTYSGKNCYTNGLKIGKTLVFVNPDPFILLEFVKPKAIKSVTVKCKEYYLSPATLVNLLSKKRIKKQGTLIKKAKRFLIRTFRKFGG